MFERCIKASTVALLLFISIEHVIQMYLAPSLDVCLLLLLDLSCFLKQNAQEGPLVLQHNHVVISLESRDKHRHHNCFDVSSAMI